MNNIYIDKKKKLYDQLIYNKIRLLVNRGTITLLTAKMYQNRKKGLCVRCVNVLIGKIAVKRQKINILMQ